MNLDYLKSIINDIFLTDSPSGYFCEINNVLISKVSEMGYNDYKINNKGNFELFIEGESQDKVNTTTMAKTL